MKPKYIFSAVFVVIVFMMTVLPRLASPSRAKAASLSAAQNPAAVAGLASRPAVQSPAQPTPAPARPTAQVVSAPKPAAAAPAGNPASAAAAKIPVIAPDPNIPKASAQSGLPVTANLPDLATFVKSVTNGQADTAVGVYVPNLFALPILQQPAGQDEFVSDSEQSVTQYRRPASFGTIALLAHNTLSGRVFFQMKANQELVLIYGDGRQVRFRVTGSESYQALSPTDTESNFVDLNGPGGKLLTHEDLFRHVYMVPSQLVFQTCITANGDYSWGRLFVIAAPENG